MNVNTAVECLRGVVGKAGDSGLQQFKQYANMTKFHAWAQVPSTQYVREPAPVARVVSYR
jgi:hypothetical protein